MAKPINNPSKANVLMESMRAMGYSFESAVADIVDNSIGVHARNVLQGISFKCGKCKRVLMFKKYTEAMIRHGAVVGSYKV